MKTDFLRTLATMAILALLAPLGTIQAQDVQLASHAEMNDLYARLAELESRVAASNVSGGCGCADAAGCGNGCGDCCDDCCGCPGFVGGAEILWLKAYHTNNAFGDFNYNEAFRFWVGYQGAGGLGGRVRVFNAGDNAANGDFYNSSIVDLEIYDAVQLGCNWDVIIGGGIRYVDYLENQTGAAGGTDRIFGTGPVVTAELYRHISDRAALLAIVRQSIVAGDGIADGAAAEDLTMSISEIQLGAQLHRDWNGGLLFARAAWEAQYYYDADDGGRSSESLIGYAFSVGLMR